MNKATVKILYTSDVHGNAMPILYGTNEQAELGLSLYASVVKEERSKHENVIVIDNGDLIQGTPLMTHYVKEHFDKENPMVGIMNRIGIDAGVIGNHEFNFGKNILSDAIEQSNYPWLSANIVDKKSEEPYFGPPYMIKTLDNGVRVAIVGVTTHYIPNWESPEHIKGIEFLDAFTSLKKWVNYIKENDKPDILITAYHGGFEKDLQSGEPTETLTGENQGYEMCTKIDGIDVLLTGHQHRTLTGVVNGVLVAQPSNNGKMYGEIVIELEKPEEKWTIIDKNASIKSVEGFPADNEILHYMKGIEASTQKWLDQPIGHIKGDMTISDPFQARINKHPFIQFIQNVQMDATDVDISVTSLLNNESKGFNSVVTMRDIVSNYMYPNTLVVLELTGKNIIQALEKSAEYFVIDDHGNIAINPMYMEPKPQHYNYDMWEGIEYTIHVSYPIGQRVKDVLFKGQPISNDQTYQVVLNNYRASGGGNYDMFKNKPIVKEIQKDTAELIHAYFEKHKIVEATMTENFNVQH